MHTLKTRTLTGITGLAAVTILALMVPTAQPLWADHSADHDHEGSHSKLSRKILDAPGRTDEDRKQDAGRKALDVYEFLGIGPGMTVADMFCSGGYNTHLLSHAVGAEGKVYSVLEFYANKDLFEGRLYKVPDMEKRIKDGNLENVELVESSGDIPAGSIDALVAIRNYHDVEWVFEGLKRKEVLASIYKAMKPGGVVGIVEAATPHEGWHNETHRLNEKVVIEDFEGAGFELAGRSEVLANPEDDHSESGFKEGRYNLDRYLLRFVKPAKGM